MRRLVRAGGPPGRAGGGGGGPGGGSFSPDSWGVPSKSKITSVSYVVKASR
ncbi:MAG: hypothetical protein IPO32_08005 [Crocinitomicaceae bacterium]|nr:hypothetical protein [Crocinitomicaceae bacterium]